MTTAAWTLAAFALSLAATLPSMAGPDSTQPDAPKDAAPKNERPRLLICAHRGASAAAPENTLAAFRVARELGADSIELDTCLSADGVPVLMHDATVDRTTDGNGKVSDLTLAQLQQLDAGSWKNEKYQGEPVPTLDEVLKTRGRLYVNIEIKVHNKDAKELADRVVSLIEKHRAEKAVIISSFSGEALEAVHARNPRVRTGFLYYGKTPETLPAGIDAVHPHFSFVDAEYMDWARSKGYQVNVWTVDNSAELRRMIDLGVNSIITNVPDVLRDILKTG